MSLPGGVLNRKGYAVGATGSWSVSNLHGDVIATVEDGSVTAAFVYDPFGQPLNPASGVVGPRMGGPGCSSGGMNTPEG